MTWEQLAAGLPTLAVFLAALGLIAIACIFAYKAWTNDHK